MVVEDKSAELAALTARQKEILRLVAQNLQAKEIGRLLNISERTVKTHTDAARRRLGVATSREAARLLVAWEGDATAASNTSANTVPEGHRPPRTMDRPAVAIPLSKREHLPGGKVSAAPVRGDMQAWLESLNPLQWLGLIVVVAVASALLLTGLIAAVLSMMQTLQGFLRAGGAI